MVEYTRPEIAQRKLADVILPAAGIRDTQVLAAFRKVRRDLFVEHGLHPRAFEDAALPIGYGQTISHPSTIAHILQALEFTGKERVLEIGTGSGYQTALLACLVEKVFTMERIRVLAKAAWQRLDALGFSNVAARIGDGTYGWPDQAPFDAVIVAAGSPEVPEHLVRQLRVGGRMVIPVGPAREQHLVKIVKRPSGVDRVPLDACRFVKLVGRFGWRKPGTDPGGETRDLDA